MDSLQGFGFGLCNIASLGASCMRPASSAVDRLCCSGIFLKRRRLRVETA